MGNPKLAESAAALRMLPSTDELLATEDAVGLASTVGQRRLATMARAAIESIRHELVAGISAAAGREATYSRESLLRDASERLKDLWESKRRSSLRRVINATGVIIHTNLGRAPLSDDAIQAMVESSRYANVEYDLATGQRGKRGAHVEDLITEITGAEAALVVNNCAAAAVLVLTVFAKGGEVVISRGELVEIGGDFRIPDVLVQSGAVLREVGTTNRTKIADYEKAINESTRLVMRVHPSNYRIVGFTNKPSLTELVDIARRKGILLYEDAGSGALFDLSEYGLDDEPVIARAIADGADIITFSGDKLLGASQAGLIVGRRDLIERLRKHPLYRALRVDKLAYAALGATLEAYLSDRAREQVPVLRMLAATREEIDARLHSFLARFDDGETLSVMDGESVVGGGAAPAVGRATRLIALSHVSLTASEIEQRLRMNETPVIARIEDDRVVLDLRTVREDEEATLFDVLKTALAV